MINYPIRDEEVSWKVYDIPINGTLTEPTDNKSYPAVVFVAGRDQPTETGTPLFYQELTEAGTFWPKY